ncbi:MAG: shikimate kinase, partial [Mobilitalea sp.]
STVGVILAKVMGFQFIDSDLLIQEQEKTLLKDIIAKKGLQGMLDIENQVNSDILTDRCVIATGGSVIYGEQAMEHLRKIGVLVYIKWDYATIDSRLENIKQRGVVFRDDQTLEALYVERCPLYEKYAHIIIDGEGQDEESIMEKIAEEVRAYWNKA